MTAAPLTTVASDRLLLVEGPDDRNFFDALIRRRLGASGAPLTVKCGDSPRVPRP